jgi:hypothetical protein
MKDKTKVQPENDFKQGEYVSQEWEEKFDELDKILFFQRAKVITKKDSKILFNKYQRIY